MESSFAAAPDSVEGNMEKKFGGKRRKKDSDMTRILSEAAGSIDKLVLAVGKRKSIENSGDAKAEPEDDDWLFCKRLYKKLNSVQEGSTKDYLKHNIDSQVLGMIHNQTVNMYAGQNQQAHRTESHFGSTSYLGAITAVDSFAENHYMNM